MINVAGRYITSKIKNPGAIGNKLFTAVTAGIFTHLDRERYLRDNPNMSKLEATAKAVGTFAMWTFFPQIGWITTFGPTAVQLGGALGRMVGAHVPEPGYRQGLGGNFFDNPAKATMRRRAVAALQESKVRANSVLGSEARRIGRGYFEY